MHPIQKTIRKCKNCKNKAGPFNLRKEKPGHAVCTVCGERIYDKDRGMTTQDTKRISSIRRRYNELSLEAKALVEGLNIRDKNGEITESGDHLINNIVKKYRNIEPTMETISIVGLARWRELNAIWLKLRKLEAIERLISKKYK